MPTYEYECTKCNRLFELFQSIKDPAKRFIATDCKECNNRAPVTRRIGTGGGIIFKGSGFYQTDYRSESYKTAAKAETDGGSTKSDSTGDGKAPAKSDAKSDAKKETKPAKKKPTTTD